jgi:hypothetical protein
MHKIYRKLAFAALFAVAVFAVPAAAQTGGIKGKVRNMDGKAIPDVTVTARRDTKDIRSVKTDKSGNFVLEGLSAGTYNFVFDGRGYAAAIKYNVEVKPGRTHDLGGNLTLAVDRGTQVIIQGSVFYSNGTSLPGAKVEIERIDPDGSAKKVTTVFSNVSGEFIVRQPETAARFRITAKFRGKTASKEIEVDSAAIYRLALTLDLEREK